MKTSSAKAKGRRACAEVRELLLAAAPALQADDIQVTPSGVTGEDLHLSPLARGYFPFTFECKNVEKLNIWDALEQAKSHATKRQDLTPVLAFRRNHSELYVSLKLVDFLKLTGKR